MERAKERRGILVVVLSEVDKIVTRKGGFEL